MEDTSVYKFELFGNTYKLQTTDGQRKTLIAVVDYYKRVVDQLYKAYPNKSQTEILMLAGVTITDKLYSNARYYESKATPNEKANYQFLSDTIDKINQNLD